MWEVIFQDDLMDGIMWKTGVCEKQGGRFLDEQRVEIHVPFKQGYLGLTVKSGVCRDLYTGEQILDRHATVTSTDITYI